MEKNFQPKSLGWKYIFPYILGSSWEEGRQIFECKIWKTIWKEEPGVEVCLQGWNSSTNLLPGLLWRLDSLLLVLQLKIWMLSFLPVCLFKLWNLIEDSCWIFGFERKSSCYWVLLNSNQMCACWKEMVQFSICCVLYVLAKSSSWFISSILCRKE